MSITIICVRFKTYMINTDKCHELVQCKLGITVHDVKKKTTTGTSHLHSMNKKNENNITVLKIQIYIND